MIQAFWIEGLDAKIEAIEWGGKDDSGVVRYDGYNPFTDSDLGAAPGFGGSGSGFGSRFHGPLSDSSEDWDI